MLIESPQWKSQHAILYHGTIPFNCRRPKKKTENQTSFYDDEMSEYLLKKREHVFSILKKLQKS
jgi:hypothetical protein